MGGYGSGRRGGRDTTDGYRQLDVRKMQRGGFLVPGSWSIWRWSRNGEVFASIQVRADFNRVVLMYRHRSYGDEDWTQEEYPVSLEWTPCYFGGERAWFLCPRPGCGRRVATLWGGAMFYCRHCYNLAYASQNETAWDRALTKAQAIRDAGLKPFEFYCWRHTFGTRCAESGMDKFTLARLMGHSSPRVAERYLHPRD